LQGLAIVLSSEERAGAWKLYPPTLVVFTITFIPLAAMKSPFALSMLVPVDNRDPRFGGAGFDIDRFFVGVQHVKRQLVALGVRGITATSGKRREAVSTLRYGASFLRRDESSAASANNHSRNVVIFGSIDVALGQMIQ
jgi:hypothetical protein